MADPDEPAVRGRIRRRLLPRTVLGTSAMVLAFAVGAAFSGTVLYSYYSYQLAQTDRRVNTLVDGYRTQFQRAEGALRATASQAQGEIDSALAGSLQAQTSPQAEQRLVHDLAPSLFLVTTAGTGGGTSVGTAWVVASDASRSLLLTSYTVVAAATARPGPQVTVRPATGGAPTTVTLRAWDPAHDLALIVLPVGHLPALAVAPGSPAPVLGQALFAVAGVGTAGGTVAAGQVSDVTATALADDVPIGPAFQGAPIVDGAGRVLAVASRTYAPLGFSSSGVWYAPWVHAACDRVLSCPGGSLPAG